MCGRLPVDVLTTLRCPRLFVFLLLRLCCPTDRCICISTKSSSALSILDGLDQKLEEVIALSSELVEFLPSPSM